MLIVVIIEFNYLQEKYEEGRQTEYNALQTSGLVFSILLLALCVLIQISFIIIAIKKQHEKGSKFPKILEGLNLKRRWFTILFFVHFYLT